MSKLKGNIGIRRLSGSLEYDSIADEQDIIQLDISPEANSTINSYQVLMNLILMGRFGSKAGIPGLKDVHNGKHFIYLPQAKPIDLNNEIKAYYDYLRKINIMA